MRGLNRGGRVREALGRESGLRQDGADSRLPRSQAEAEQLGDRYWGSVYEPAPTRVGQLWCAWSNLRVVGGKPEVGEVWARRVVLSSDGMRTV